MRESNPLTQPVNIIISMVFVGVFGLVCTSVLLKAAELDDPITGMGALVADQLIDE